MVYRYSWIAGLLAIGYGLTRLNSLLRPSTDGPPWQLVVFAGVLLGAIITWTALTYRLSTAVAAGINLVALTIAAFRVVAPTTTALFLPTPASLSVFAEEWGIGVDVIRAGVSPVIPVPGLIAIVMALFWGLGALLAWGLLRSHPFVALLPALAVGLQLTTVDRRPTSHLVTLAFISLLAFALLAVTLDHRDQRTGRMTRSSGPAHPSRRVQARSAALLSVMVLASLVVSGGLRSVVPRDGALEWRSSSGLTGGFYGSVTFNPFISIRRGLVANSGTTMFWAQVDGDVDASDVYYRLTTMEHFDGEQFFALEPQVRPLLGGDGTGESAGQAFAGPTAEVTQTIVIEALAQDWMPAAYTPIAVDSEDGRLLTNMSVRDDGSLVLDGGLTRRRMAYEVTSAVPQPDLGVLSIGDDGAPSAVFAAAEEAGREPFALPDVDVIVTRPEPPDVEQYLDLPDDFDAAITALAREQTRNLETDYERGLALEAFLRGFNYSVEVPEGHSGADLATWLLDESAVGYYRTGYCEQFATSMAVMARALGIPSRVVLGFTPGREVRDDNEDLIPGLVQVLDNNAHAWVELWMPAQGWVRFDPTPRTDGINPSTVGSLPYDVTPFLDLPDPEPIAANTGGGLIPQFADDTEIPNFIGAGGGAEEGAGFSIPPWLRWALPVVVVVIGGFALVPGIKWLRRRRRLKRLEEGDISAAWQEIVERLVDLGAQPDPASTPSEVATEIESALAPLATVYGESLYGPPGRVDAARIAVATQSMENVEARLTTKYSKPQRLIAWYRPGSVLPRFLRRKRND